MSAGKTCGGDAGARLVTRADEPGVANVAEGWSRVDASENRWVSMIQCARCPCALLFYDDRRQPFEARKAKRTAQLLIHRCDLYRLSFGLRQDAAEGHAN
jgi:hypothetical protein